MGFFFAANFSLKDQAANICRCVGSQDLEFPFFPAAFWATNRTHCPVQAPLLLPTPSPVPLLLLGLLWSLAEDPYQNPLGSPCAPLVSSSEKMFPPPRSTVAADLLDVEQNSYFHFPFKCRKFLQGATLLVQTHPFPMSCSHWGRITHPCGHPRERGAIFDCSVLQSSPATSS